MAISKLGGTGSDNWELISSVTPTALAASVNFTGLSPYRKLLVRWTGIVFAASDSIRLRLNNDSGTNYQYMYNEGGGQAQATLTTQITMNPTTASNSYDGYAIFTNCDTTGIKNLTEGCGNIGTAENAYYLGLYYASAAISQVNVITGSTFTAVGTVALYGVK